MRAVIYHGPGQKSWEETADPKIEDDGAMAVSATADPGTRPRVP